MNSLLQNDGTVRYKVKFQNEKTQINYDIIQSALSINGLSQNDEISAVEATSEFVKLMKQIDNSTSKKSNSQNNYLKPRAKFVSSQPQWDINHDIKQYTKLYHPHETLADEKKPLKERLKKLKDLCQTMPFKRTTDEVDNIFRILKTVSPLASQVDDDMLRLLSNVAIYECIEEPGVTLFGNKGFYILLNGVIEPLNIPYVRSIGEPVDRFIQGKHGKNLYSRLSRGECFGTLDEIVLDDINCSKLLMAEIIEPCELILITTSYYRRILEKYNSQRHTDKLLLLKCQEAFTVWPHQALVKIANIFSWSTIPANRLVCREGEISPILAFIQSGSCDVLRKLDVKETLANGKVITKTTDVKIGVMRKGQSFGEVSMLDQKPMKHSIVAREDMFVIQTDLNKLLDLDEDVKLLLRQSCATYFYDFIKDDVESIFIKQKSKKDWLNFKDNVISDVIESRGIRPGQGKWRVTAK